MWLLPAQLNPRSRCRKCQENAQVDKLLQTPKDEVTQFGVEHALRLDREAEHEVLLTCQKCAICERMVLQRILDFLRVPFVTTQNGMHYCELCDIAFGELVVAQGQRVHMSSSHDQIDWKGCPGPRLAFNITENFSVAELRKARNDRWFFRTLVAPPKPTGVAKLVPVEAEASEFAPPGRQGGSSSSNALAGSDVPSTTPSQTFTSFWAPLDATVEGGLPSPLMEHLNSTNHKNYEAVVVAGKQTLVGRAAIKLARHFGEEPTLALSRFRAGLGITGRFCEPQHVELAAKLERVRDTGIPVKFLREVLPLRQDFLWITPAELWEAEEKHEQRRKRGTRK